MKIEATVLIRRPPEDVFAYVADYGNDAAWRRDVVEMTPSPPGPATPGTRVHEVLRFGGRTHVTDTTVVEVVPGRALTFEGGGTGGQVRGSRVVAAVPEGTRLTTRLEVDTRGALRVLEPLLVPMFRRGTQRDLAALREQLEAGQTATGAGSDVPNAAAASRR